MYSLQKKSTSEHKDPDCDLDLIFDIYCLKSEYLYWLDCILLSVPILGWFE